MIPLRFHELENGSLVFTSDTGVSFISSETFLKRYVHDQLTSKDDAFIAGLGLQVQSASDPLSSLSYINYLSRFVQRHSFGTDLSYFMLVPTLRCDLSCSYCQVSRVSDTTKGFDWTPEITDASIDFILQSEADNVKIEFQGGEPTLRPDLLRHVIESVTKEKTAQFVICTNLSRLDDDVMALINRDDVFVSTSVDGSKQRQLANRTATEATTTAFYDNCQRITERHGSQKISALPTIDPFSPPSYEELTRAYAELGLQSVYLRPVNFHGFARKSHSHTNESFEKWISYHEGFIDFLVERNSTAAAPMEEYYFTHCLKRIFQTQDGHTDLRNPSLFGADYVVINHDGRLFPTDEARMLDRIGEIDLAIGDVSNGFDMLKLRSVNSVPLNDDDPDCIHCAFQPYCGTDVIDTISRYGRVDIPRHETYFCRIHTYLFDKAFRMLENPTPSEARSLFCWLDLPQTPIDLLPRHD